MKKIKERLYVPEGHEREFWEKWDNIIASRATSRYDFNVYLLSLFPSIKDDIPGTWIVASPEGSRKPYIERK